MRIGMILDREFPVDERVEKEAISLIQAGFEIHILCFTFGKLKKFEIYKNINIHRVYIPKIWYKKFSALILIFPFYNWFWWKHINKFIKTEKIDVLHIHDLPLVGVGIKIKRNFMLPLVVDMHEDYADWIVNTKHYNTFIGKIIKKLSPWKNYEKKCLQNSDYIIGVSNLLIKKMILEHNLIRSKIVFVPNSPDISLFNNPTIPSKIKKKFDGKFNLVYAGGIDYLRGLQNVLPKIKELISEISKIQLIIIGDGSYKSKLIDLTKKLGLERNIIFTGWLQLKELASFLNCADVGIYPQLKYKGIEYTLPTKIYQYCAAGIPVISNDHYLPRKVIEDNKCGFIVNFEINDNKFNETIKYLYENPKIKAEMGERGKKMVLKKYNWNNTVEKLINMYNDIKKYE